jgi:hypothetical protein
VRLKPRRHFPDQTLQVFIFHRSTERLTPPSFSLTIRLHFTETGVKNGLIIENNPENGGFPRLTTAEKVCTENRVNERMKYKS